MPRQRRTNLLRQRERRARKRAKRTRRRKAWIARRKSAGARRLSRARRRAKRAERRMKLRLHDAKFRHREKYTPMPSVTVGTSYFRNKNTGVVSNLVVYRSKDIVPNGKLGALAKTVCYDRVHPGPPYRRGGPLNLFRAENPMYQVLGRMKTAGRVNNSTEFIYDGGMIPTSYGPNAPSTTDWEQFGYAGRFQSSTFGDISDADAATAYNRARPKIERADLAVFTGEFREVPDQFRGTAKYFHDTWKAMGGNMRSPVMQPKRVADEFLNHQFGWAPFIGDLLKFYDTYRNTDEYMEQITRDNGQWIRRKRRIGLPTTEMLGQSRVYTAQVYPGPQSFVSEFRVIDGNSTRGYTDFEWKRYTISWFEGSFKYYLPQFDPGLPQYRSRYFEVMRYVTLYGARVSPSTVWNLLPYSWLADWVSNAGDVVDNFTASIYDNLANRYAFAMRTTVEEYHNKTVIFNSDGTSRYGHWTARAIRKLRKHASPFGFGLTSLDFTPRQIAILLSLGISRSQ